MPPTVATGPWLDKNKAADYLGLHPETIAQAFRRGDLQSIRIGQGPRARYRTCRAWCDDYIFNHGTAA